MFNIIAFLILINFKIAQLYDLFIIIIDLVNLFKFDFIN